MFMCYLMLSSSSSSCTYTQKIKLKLFYFFFYFFLKKKIKKFKALILFWLCITWSLSSNVQKFHNDHLFFFVQDNKLWVKQFFFGVEEGKKKKTNKKQRRKKEEKEKERGEKKGRTNHRILNSNYCCLLLLLHCVHKNHQGNIYSKLVNLFVVKIVNNDFNLPLFQIFTVLLILKSKIMIIIHDQNCKVFDIQKKTSDSMI
ncbi:hypothetical protein RFI_21572 [Reticulomyxa filosa]|uniref:Uncharacterized protein n=1 Tax=Reticulomyxa filosa TaxID=46433 RepID=X6MQ63_RETFI|nr:hypothetical protein RFI_21572 [Reticulomyxa filosa]|eukprot:ETO15791.1 hypothetical protein RFI_21572 [Reticulomyxa filosa]